MNNQGPLCFITIETYEKKDLVCSFSNVSTQFLQLGQKQAVCTGMSSVFILKLNFKRMEHRLIMLSVCLCILMIFCRKSL